MVPGCGPFSIRSLPPADSVSITAPFTSCLQIVHRTRPVLYSIPPSTNETLRIRWTGFQNPYVDYEARSWRNSREGQGVREKEQHQHSESIRDSVGGRDQERERRQRWSAYCVPGIMVRPGPPGEHRQEDWNGVRKWFLHLWSRWVA